MFSKILIPVDFSPPNHEALEQARPLLPTGGRVFLLHVIEKIQGLDEGDDQAFYRRLQHNAEQKLAELVADAAKLGLEAEGRVTVGKRPLEILTCARDMDISLIIMNSTKIDLNQPYQGVDSTSHSVAVFAQCPVLLLK